MIDLKDKNILFISPAFFGYEKAILNRCRELGAVVDYFDERPANSFWVKTFIRLNRNLLFFYISRYYDFIYNSIKNNNYDYVFVVNLEAMPKSFLHKIKMNCPSAMLILYMWDSLKNKKNALHYISYFDKVFSFDKDDCLNNNSIIFRPLFFLNEYAEISKYQKYKYDLLFIGTIHSDRYVILQKIKRQLENKKYYFYLYLQNWKLFFLYKIKYPIYRNAHIHDFKYAPLSKKKLFNLISCSRIIIDIQHPKQVGLTIRTIEMLGARRKLITTNVAIKEYDFYNSNNILVIDRENPEIPEMFFKESYEPIEQKIYDKYSLDGWLSDIFMQSSNSVL